LILGATSEKASLETISYRLAAEHLADKMDRTKLYSCPSNMLVLESLTSVLSEPLTKRPRHEQENQLRPEGELGDNTFTTSVSDSVYFQLVHAHIGRKKTVHVHAGAGGRVQGKLLVSVHNRLSGFGNDLVVSSRAATASAASGPGFVLRGFANAPLESIQV
jgi:hypothetical protein